MDDIVDLDNLRMSELIGIDVEAMLMWRADVLSWAEGDGCRERQTDMNVVAIGLSWIRDWRRCSCNGESYKMRWC